MGVRGVRIGVTWDPHLGDWLYARGSLQAASDRCGPCLIRSHHFNARRLGAWSPYWRDALLLEGLWGEPGVVVLGNPVYGEELPSGVQSGSFHVQRPHQAVLARVRQAPVRELGLALKRVGGYALSGLALVIRVELSRSPVPARVIGLVGDFPEVPADHQLSVHHLPHLHRA